MSWGDFPFFPPFNSLQNPHKFRSLAPCLPFHALFEQNPISFALFNFFD
jgi:hypothetical protein